MKKFTAIIAFICIASLSDKADNTPKSVNSSTKTEKTATATAKESKMIVLGEMQVCYEYAMCGHSGNACGEGIDGCLEILNMLDDMYCG